MEFLEVKHDKNIAQNLLSNSKGDLDLDVREVEEIDNGNGSVEDDEEMMLHIPLINDFSDVDEERKEARVKVSKYVQLKKTVRNEGGNEDNGGGKPTDCVDYPAEQTVDPPEPENEHVDEYESDYKSSSDPRNFLDTSGQVGKIMTLLSL